MADQIALTDYLVLGDDPHLVANECTSCGARFFDRRNACASCGATWFTTVPISTTGEVRAFTIVAFAAPGIPVPFVAAVPASDIASAGTATVTVVNPSPGGGASNSLTFTINAPGNPVPVISSLSPPSAAAGGAAFTLTVNGSSFITASTVHWNGTLLTTTYSSATKLTAAVPAPDIASAGTASVTVVNPTPGGGTSNAATFTITSGTGTDFATVCNNVFTTLENLVVSCYHANPALFSGSTNGIFTGAGCADWQKEITAGRVTYSSTQGAACNTAVGQLTCASLDLSNPVPPACTAALTGTVSNGNTCYNSVDCLSGSYCTAQISSAPCPGTCQPFLAAGAVCTSSDQCGPSAECTGTTPMTCVTLSTAAGGACPCAGNLWCDTGNTAGGPNGTCTAFLGTGATCTSSTACGGGKVCVGTVANPTPTTCQPSVGSGGDCTASSSLCGPGWECQPSTSPPTMLCVSPPGVGSPCGINNLFCIGGYCGYPALPTCQPYLAPGAACTSATSFYCQPGYTCINSVCALAHCSAP